MYRYMPCDRVLCVLGAVLLVALCGCPEPVTCPDNLLGEWSGSTTLYDESGPTGIRVEFGEDTLTLSSVTPFGCTDTIEDIPYTYEDCKITFDGSYELDGDCYDGTRIQGRIQGKMTFLTEDTLRVDAYHGFRGTYDGQQISRTYHVILSLGRER